MLTKKQRQAIFSRDGNQCTKCHRKTDLHVHHIKAKVFGGTDEDENLITLCLACHDEWHAVETVADLQFAEWLEIPSLIAFIDFYRLLKILKSADSLERFKAYDAMMFLEDLFKQQKARHENYLNEEHCAQK